MASATRFTEVLESPRVSRRHALIHLQNIGEFWLIDFGSSNGGFLNKHRIHHPVRLSDGDQITIGDKVFRFRQPQQISEEYKTIVMQRTLRGIENIPCWLLVADIRNFIQLSESMRNEGQEMILGAWLAACKEITETHHGIINKYLGDGFLAYWPAVQTSPEEIVAVISELKELHVLVIPSRRAVECVWIKPAGETDGAGYSGYISEFLTAAENGLPKARRRWLSISPAESLLQGHCRRIANGIQTMRSRRATASSI